MMQNSFFWEWLLRVSIEQRAESNNIPTRIITFAAGFQPENLPPEISMLLPTVSGTKRITQALATSPQLFNNAIVGLFVTDPSINFEQIVDKLKAANNQWITNLPSISLHEAEFKGYLTEVNLGFSKEIELLAKFKAHNFKVMAVLTDQSEAKLTANLNPDAVLIMPKVSDFLDGWPSLATRKKDETEIRALLRQNGWKGLCLGYRESNEDNNGWPCVVRPRNLAY